MWIHRSSVTHKVPLKEEENSNVNANEILLKELFDSLLPQFDDYSRKRIRTVMRTISTAWKRYHWQRDTNDDVLWLKYKMKVEYIGLYFSIELGKNRFRTKLKHLQEK